MAISQTPVKPSLLRLNQLLNSEVLSCSPIQNRGDNPSLKILKFKDKNIQCVILHVCIIEFCYQNEIILFDKLVGMGKITSQDTNHDLTWLSWAASWLSNDLKASVTWLWLDLFHDLTWLSHLQSSYVIVIFCDVWHAWPTSGHYPCCIGLFNKK